MLTNNTRPVTGRKINRAQLQCPRCHGDVKHIDRYNRSAFARVYECLACEIIFKILPRVDL